MDSTSAPIEALRAKIKQGQCVLLDGATGTELQMRGATMHEAVWCATATATHPEILEGIHVDYIKAGAEVITANTFSSHRLMLDPAGLGDQLESLNTQAVNIAQAARNAAAAAWPVAVAGSMSHQVPIKPGTDQRRTGALPPADRLQELFAEFAAIHQRAGVDLLLMEMMSDPELAVPAVKAAMESGLPVWVGTSAKVVDGRLVAYSRPDLDYVEMARELIALGADVYGVMHSNTQVTRRALEALREHYDGPLMAYPDMGHFKMPIWTFEGELTPEELANEMQCWQRDFNVSILGGCCGLGLDYMRAMAAACR